MLIIFYGGDLDKKLNPCYNEAVHISFLIGFTYLALPPVIAAENTGQAGAFLRQEVGARGSALSGALTAAVDDSAAFIFNPAGFSRMIKPEFHVTHAILYQDTNLDFTAGAFPTKRWGSFAAGYLAQVSNGFERRSSPLDAPAEFSIKQTAFMGGWARAFPWPLAGRWRWLSNPKPLAIGLAFKSITERIDTISSSGNSLDLGLTLRPGERFEIGAQVQNLLAPQLSFISRGYGYPRVIDISPALVWPLARDWRLMIAARVRKVADEKLSQSGGAELTFGDMLAARVGYKDGFSSGVGLRWGNTQIDYAAMLGGLGLSHTMTLIRRFGQTRAELEKAIIKGIAQFTRGEAERLSKAYLQKAEADLREERLAEALRGLEAASLWDPKNNDIPKRIAVLTSRVDNALTAQLIGRAEAMAMAQYNEGHFLSSRQYWQSILEMDPRYDKARHYLNRIDAKLTAEDLKRLEAFDQARTSQKIQAAMREIQAALNAERFAQAAQSAEKIWKQDPKNLEIQKLLLKAKRGLEASIAERLNQADRLTSANNYAAALGIIGGILMEDPSNAKALKKEIELKPALRKILPAETQKQVDQLYYRGVENYIKGDLEAADALIRQVIQLDATYDPARVLEEKIQAAIKVSR